MSANEVPESNLTDVSFWNPTKDPSDYGLPSVFDLISATLQYAEQSDSATEIISEVKALTQSSSIKAHPLNNVLFLSCSCGLRDSWWLFLLKGWSWWTEHFPCSKFNFWCLQAKKILFPLKARLTPHWSILTFGLRISHLQSPTVVGLANPQRSTLQRTKACYVKEMSCGQRYHL